MERGQATIRASANGLRWAARLLALGLLLVWGAFFVEHVGWFREPSELPPAPVLVVQGLHALMLAGFVTGWWRERLGALLVIAGAVPFFAITAGSNAWWFAGTALLPALLWILSDRRGPSARSRAAGSS
jgi:hypothetical protein